MWVTKRDEYRKARQSLRILSVHFSLVSFDPIAYFAALTVHWVLPNVFLPIIKIGMLLNEGKVRHIDSENENGSIDSKFDEHGGNPARK